mgnify:CR=1 FL=1
MFTDEELELIEEILTEHGEGFVQTRVELQRLDSILQKLDRLLNGQD